MIIIFKVFKSFVFSSFGQFTHLKRSLIIEQMMWEILNKLQSFSCGPEESRTGLLSQSRQQLTGHRRLLGWGARILEAQDCVTTNITYSAEKEFSELVSVFEHISKLRQRGTFAFQPVFLHVTQLFGCLTWSLTIGSMIFYKQFYASLPNQVSFLFFILVRP